MRRFFSKSRKNKNIMPTITALVDLPLEMVNHIFSFLNLEDLKNVSLINKYFFKLTETLISDKCLINPFKPHYDFIPINSLRRIYCNVKLDYVPDHQMNFKSIIPRTLYFQEQILGNIKNEIEYAEKIPEVKKVFLGVMMDDSDDPQLIRPLKFGDRISYEISHLRIKYTGNNDRLLMWISEFSKEISHLTIVFLEKIENFNIINYQKIVLSSLQKFEINYGICESEQFKKIEDFLRMLEINKYCIPTLHLDISHYSYHDYDMEVLKVILNSNLSNLRVNLFLGLGKGLKKAPGNLVKWLKLLNVDFLKRIDENITVIKGNIQIFIKVGFECYFF